MVRSTTYVAVRSSDCVKQLIKKCVMTKKQKSTLLSLTGDNVTFDLTKAFPSPIFSLLCNDIRNMGVAHLFELSILNPVNIWSFNIRFFILLLFYIWRDVTLRCFFYLFNVNLLICQYQYEEKQTNKNKFYSNRMEACVWTNCVSLFFGLIRFYRITIASARTLINILLINIFELYNWQNQLVPINIFFRCRKVYAFW